MVLVAKLANQKKDEHMAKSKKDDWLKERWVLVAGAALGSITLLFFMLMVVLSAFGLLIPQSERYLAIFVLSLGASLASAFLGGHAAAKGTLRWPFKLGNQKPLEFGVAGGVAVLVILLFLGWLLFGGDNGVVKRKPELTPDLFKSSLSKNREDVQRHFIQDVVRATQSNKTLLRQSEGRELAIELT